MNPEQLPAQDAHSHLLPQVCGVPELVIDAKLDSEGISINIPIKNGGVSAGNIISAAAVNADEKDVLLGASIELASNPLTVTHDMISQGYVAVTTVPGTFALAQHNGAKGKASIVFIVQDAHGPIGVSSKLPIYLP
jgi:hypothetical protein